jgi:proteasome lid subunit RPN8/RPN11
MLRLAQADLDAIRAQAEQDYPRECCGVLVGSNDAGIRQVRSVIACRNTRAEFNRYEIEPAELVRIQREHRSAGDDIVGFYHSHPDHPAQPSQTDLAEAHWTGCSYVIISVAEGKATDTHSFELTGPEDAKRFIPEALDIT